MIAPLTPAPDPRAPLRRAFRIAVGGVVLAVTLGLGYLLWRDDRLSVPPPVRADAGTPAPPADSRVALALDVPYPLVAALVDHAFDGLAGTKTGVMEAECLELLGARDCLELRWKLRYDRAGRATAAPDGKGGLRLTLPGKMDAQIGFSGAPARLLGLDRKTMVGAFTVSATVKAALGEDYCPRVDVADVRFDWVGGADLVLAPRRELRVPGVGRLPFGPVKLPLGQLLEDDLSVLLRGLARKAAAAVPCAQLRAQLRDHWRVRRLETPRPSALGPGPGLSVTLAPRGLSAADPVAAPTALRLNAAALIGVAATPADAPPPAVETPSLPPLGRMTGGEGGKISLAAPISLRYADVAAALRGAVAEPLRFDTPLGPAQLTLDAMTVRPSAPLVTLMAEATLSWPERGRSSGLTLWLTARPALDADDRLRLEEVSVRRRWKDDWLLGLATAALHDRLTQKIADLSVDLKPLLARTAEQAAGEARSLAAVYGVDLKLTAPRLSLGHLTLGEEMATLEVGAEASLAATLLSVKTSGP